LSKEDSKLEPEGRIEKRLATALGNSDSSLTITDTRLVAMFAAAKPIKAFLDDVEEFLQLRADQGNPVLGTKLVAGREGNREWTDTEAVDKLLAPKLKADRFKKELISPAQAEKLLPRKDWSTRFTNLFDGYVTRSGPKNKIALASDKREAVLPPVSALPDLTQEDDERI